LATVKEADGDYLPARRRLAELAFLEGNADESLAVLNDLFKKAKDDVEGHVIRGRIYLTKRQTTEAIQDFQSALRVDSKMVQARYWLAVAYHQTGNVQQARTELAQAVELSPRATDAVLLLAQINLEPGNAAATIESMTKLVGEQPRLPQAYLLLGMAQLSKRDPAAALQTFRKMESAVAKDVRAVYLAGLSLQGLGQKSEAIREFERALSMKPAFIDPLTSLVAQAIADGKTDVAVDRVRKQITAAGNSARLQFLLGSVHHVRKETALAEAAYTKALELDQALVPAYVSLGQLYLQGQDEQRALARFEQALKVNPNDVVSRMLVGQISLGRGETAKAKTSYESILAVNPRFAPAANNLAWVL